MNLLTFQAIGWFIGSAVLLALAAALLVSAKRQSDDTGNFAPKILAAIVLYIASFLFGFGWHSLSVGLFGGVK